jgi:hypothetical protein
MKHRRDYSQPGYPYGLSEYTDQSADQDIIGEKWDKVGVDRDVRGNTTMPARNVPTQAEADAIKRQVD